MGRTLEGTILSTAMMGTITVSVSSRKIHKRYKKIVVTTKKIKASVPKDKKYNVGDKVTISECRPVAKTVKFRVV